MDAQQMVEIRIERIDNDANGNPKYRAHWLDFVSVDEALSVRGCYGIARGRALAAGWRPEKNKGADTGRFVIVSHLGKSGLAAEILAAID